MKEGVSNRESWSPPKGVENDGFRPWILAEENADDGEDWPHPRDPWGLAKENTKRWNDYPGYNYWDDWLVKVGDSNS